MSVQGRLLNSNGSPVTASSVAFTVQVRSPGSEDCLLYQESMNLNLSKADGAFALTLGSGTRAAANVDGGQALNTIFSNSASISLAAATSACANADTFYTPSVSDTRKVVIAFDDGTGPDTIPSISLAWVPQAMYAQNTQQLGGVNAQQFLRVAVGTTTPSTLSVMDYLNLTSLLATPAANYVKASSNGSAVLPMVSGDPSSGLSLGQIWYDTSLNVMKYYDGSVKTMGTSAGLASVGLSMPSLFAVTGSPLSANGTISVNLASQNANLIFAGPSTGTGTPAFRSLVASDLPTTGSNGAFVNGGNSFGTGATLGTNDNNTLSIKTNNATAMTILANGNVGIGTTTPALPLDVVGDMRSSGNVFTSTLRANTLATNGTSDLVLKNTGAKDIIFQTDNGTERARIVNTTGNVGIGTPAPASALHIAVDNTSSANYGALSIGAGPFDGVSVGKFSGSSNGTELAINAASGFTGTLIAASVAGGGRFSVDANGAIYIGNGTLGHSASVISGNNSNVTFKNNSTGAGSYSVLLGGASTTSSVNIQSTSAVGTGDFIKFTTGNNGSTEVMRMISNGKVGIGTTTPVVSLDLGSKTDALFLPSGTTAQQPSTSIAGMLRWNTTNSAAEIYNGSAWVNLAGTSSTGSLSGVSVLTGSSSGLSLAAGGTNQNITLTASGTGLVTSGSVVTLTNATASTGYNNGALVISGGVGISGALNTNSTVYAAGSITSGTSMYSPLMYGGTAASGNLTIDSTSHATKGNLILAPSGGYVGIGTTSPTSALDVSGGINISGLNAIRYPASDSTLGNSMAIGLNTLTSQTTTGTAYQNVAIGANALASNTSGLWSTAVGVNALNLQTSTGANTAVGRSSLSANTTGTGWNSAFGTKSGNAISTGAYNTSIGALALGGNSGGAVTGSNNTAVGYGAAGNTTGSALLTSGSNNTFLGSQVGSATLTTGSSNILIGGSSAVDVPTSTTSNFLNIGNTIFATGVGSGTLAAPAGSVGIGTVAPTHSLTIASIGSGYANYNTADQTTNYERGVLKWVGNTYLIGTEFGGTAATRTIRIGSGGTAGGAVSSGRTIDFNGSPPFFSVNASTTLGGNLFDYSSVSLSGSSTSQVAFSINPTVTQTSTASFTALKVNPTLTSVGSGSVFLMDLQNSGTSKMVVNSAGSVGIGTTTPSSPLHVTGDIRTDLKFIVSGAGYVQSAGGGLNLYGVAGQNVVLSAGASESMRILASNGNVGIGTTAPSSPLHVVASTASEGIRIQRSATTNQYLSLHEDDGSAHTIEAFGDKVLRFKNRATSYGMDFYVNNGATQAMTILASGNIGIGTTTPSYKLHVVGSSGATVGYFSDGTQSCSITPATAGNISCSSDERLKQNIQTYADATSLENILKLQTVTYEWKSVANGRHTGFIAQEVEKIAPEFVTTGADGYKQVSYTGFIPWITGAIKALYGEVVQSKADSLIQARQIASKADAIEVQILKNEFDAKTKKLEDENNELKARLQKLEQALGVK